MSTLRTSPAPRGTRRQAFMLLTFVGSLVLAMLPLLAFTTTAARACACGCSVFDVGGGMLPQENDHGGRIFFEYWYSDQNVNWIGSARGNPNLNQDKKVVTTWTNVGLSYMFNRQWGMMVRVPFADRDFTTTVDPTVGLEHTFNSKSVGDIELVGMYTGFFDDMSTGVTFGIKLPTGTYTAFGFDRDTQIGTGSTDLLLGGFHRGLITGDNHWQYFSQVRWQVPFLYSAAYDRDLGTYALYKPGYQADGALGVLYNNLYNVLGFDKITPLAQVIASHRVHDNGPASDPLNTGFDRLMISPGVEFTKVLDEANNRVLKVYADVEIPFYYRVNAADNGGLPVVGGTEGQLIAPVLVKAVASYNF
ncbi:MAG: hypothetical protein JO228_15050 [Xanthobacteraceae bacterium]|nr:hypothetical protein [Xanthobacteraceae bacterium]